MPISAKTFLVKKLGLSHQEALEILLDKRLLVNNKPASIDQHVSEADEVFFEDKKLQTPLRYVYIAYYKPRGVETTLNKDIPNNLAASLGFPEKVFPLGRLDKDSEGLLLLTNDGKLYNKITHSQSHQEKEYFVIVDKEITEEQISALRRGIIIMGQKTRPAQVELVGKNSFHITLTQGLNRQIRRMCYKLGLEVLTLKRTRIQQIHLGDLQQGKWRMLTPMEVNALKY